MIKINFTYIYNIKGEIKLVDVLNYNIEDFKQNSTLYYPDFNITTMCISDIKFENPIFENSALREKTREELILEGRTELLFDGEYIDGKKIVVVPMLENISNQKWDIKSHTWIDTTTSYDKAREKYREYKCLDTPLNLARLEKKGLRKEYEDMMNKLFDIIPQLENAKGFIQIDIPEPSKSLQELKEQINKIGG